MTDRAKPIRWRRREANEAGDRPRLGPRSVALRQYVDNLDEKRRRVPWPTDVAPAGRGPEVAVVTVSYNTAELLSHLLFSLFRILEPGLVTRIVVVENGSSDLSRAILGPLVGAGMVEVVENRRRPYHGPGLNRGISYLATGSPPHRPPPTHIWVLDSDVVVLRRDALSAGLAAMDAAQAVLAGQFVYEPCLLEGYAHPCSNLLLPHAVWRRGVPPFQEHGAPGAAMQRALRRQAATILDFPFCTDNYLLHLGRGTLRSVAGAGMRGNRYYNWARDHSEYHFSGNPNGPALFEEFLTQFRDNVPSLTPDALLQACKRAAP